MRVMGALYLRRKRERTLRGHWGRRTRYTSIPLHFPSSVLIRNQVAILLNHGLLSTGSTVDEAGFLFGLLDRGCAIQLKVEAAMAGNPKLVKHVVTDEEAAYNFKMASEKNALYAEAQPDLDYEFAMAGPGVIERGKRERWHLQQRQSSSYRLRKWRSSNNLSSMSMVLRIRRLWRLSAMDL